MSLNSQVPQEDIFAAFVAGVEKGSEEFPFRFCSASPPPHPPPPPPPDVSDAILWTATKLSLHN